MTDRTTPSSGATQPDGPVQPGTGLMRFRLLPQALRSVVRSREAGLALVGLVVGLISGVLVWLVGWTVQALHVVLFDLAPGQRLSASEHLAPWRVLLVPALGGVVLAGLGQLGRKMGGRLADAIEANALYGGRLSLTGSAFVTMQTVVSSGCGASVGLEAGYAQIGAAVASRIGLALAARRADLRLLVACGAGGAISAAFGAPLAGAFYAFEVVLGAYTVGALAPVAASTLVASLVMRGAEPQHLPIRPGLLGVVSSMDLVHILAVTMVCAALGIVLMLAVSATDVVFRRLRLPAALRTMAGGLVVGLLGLVSPQVLGAGHGAMERDFVAALAPGSLALIIAVKGLASAISLGSGFRGGLFYASLLIGALVGRLYADAAGLLDPGFGIQTDLAALTGMVAFSSGVIGAPLTMTAIALETTGDFSITAAALIAATLSSMMVRELFGYSFATWRFHLRGEAIRGPHDVGWMRDLSVRKLMRTDVTMLPATLTIAEARTKVPLGSAKLFILLNEQGRYAGIVMLDDLYTSAEAPGTMVGVLGTHQDEVLFPWLNIREALARFAAHEADALVVLDHEATRRVLGLVTEAHALRRYGEELERQNPNSVVS